MTSPSESPSPSPSPSPAPPDSRRKPSRSRSNPFVRLGRALNAPGPYPIAPGQLPPSQAELAHEPHHVPAAVQLPSALAAAAAVAGAPGPQLPAPSPWSQELLASCPPHVLEQLQEEVSAMLARVGGELRRAEKQVARLRRERDEARAGAGAVEAGGRGGGVEGDGLRGEVERLRREVAVRDEVIGSLQARWLDRDGDGEGAGASASAGQGGDGREPPPEYHSSASDEMRM